MAPAAAKTAPMMTPMTTATAVLIDDAALAVAAFATAAMLSATQHIDQVVTEQQDNAGIPPWVYFAVL